MEENKKQILQGQRPQKLNLNAPLLSTRRPFSLHETNTTTSNYSSNMVPFSWERIAGEPKDKETSDDSIEPPPPPPPKLPPGRWQPPVVEEVNGATDHAFDGFYDVDEEEEYGHSDIFSLAESIVNDVEVNCATTNDRSSTILDGYCHSPNFIIQRFLPDAQALAEASVVKKKVPFSTSPHANGSLSRAVSINRRSYHSPKGCGLGGLFPWKMKAKPCSVKSPVCDTIIGTNPKHNR
ncbi:hypothetical protein ACP275_12G179400 [Erythranthe tilingii]